MKDLQQVYNQIINEETKAKRKIDDIGRKLKAVTDYTLSICVM